ncbi:GIY-YIG nuclease family protein [Pseudaquabacterium pictum]|nr:GIY-YIG nuclease family protein [Rubrivivax pictus]
MVSLATFTSRIRRLVERHELSDATINESLNLSADDFRRKYATRRTLVEVDGQPIDLMSHYAAKATEAAISYRNFWQRVRGLAKKGQICSSALADSLTLSAATWRSCYGGGRSTGFVYEGNAHPDQVGKRFHSVAALLHSVGRYDDRALIWSRLKAGWTLDDALAILNATPSHRTGTIYRVTRRRTGAVYVGLTVTSIKQRWAFHVRRATDGSTSKLHAAFREDGADGFDIDVLEDGIRDLAVLQARESFWVDRLGALGPNGLNTAKPGGLGSPGGKIIGYGDETFRSIEEAASVLSERLGIAPHVIRTRLQNGLPLPQPEQVRRHSKNPDAGSNLFRRWLALLKRHSSGVAAEWKADYDRFKADVSPVPSGLELIRKRPSEPWGPGNVEWVTVQTKVARTHGKAISVNGVEYPSLTAIAKAHGIGVSTFKNRIYKQGMSAEQAVVAPLGGTS